MPAAGPSLRPPPASVPGLLAVGSVALDGVTTPAGSVDGVIGGSAVYFSAAASLLAPVRLVGVAGDDYPLGELDFLRRRGVDLAGLERRPGDSFYWAGRYRGEDLGLRDTIETRLGVFADFDPVVPAAFRDSEVVFLGNIDPVLQRSVLDQSPARRLAAADTMNYWIEGSPDALMSVLAGLDILFLNDEEAVQLSGRADLSDAAEWIRARGPAVVVVKRGARGAVLFAEGWAWSCPAHPPDRLEDPTGAGDAFAGGFMGSLARELAGAAPVGAAVAEDAMIPEREALPGSPTSSQRLRWSGEAPATRGALRRAAAFGCAMGSLAVETFSVDRFRDLDLAEAQARAGRLAERQTAGSSA